jgi:type IV secretion system protein VirB9
MTRQFFVTLVCLLLLVLQPKAEERPIAGRSDPRMRTLAYNPNEVVRLSTAVGATLVVTFGANETVNAVAVSDSKDLAALPKANYLFFKARAALTPQPVVVLTSTPTGGMRRYVFNVTTRSMDNLEASAPDLYYSVQFTYPADEAAARQRAVAERNAVRRADAAARETARLHRSLEERTGNPYIGKRNWRYIAQGDKSLTPLEVFDNGYTTVFHFPGNVRVPAIFVIAPDGKESTANYAVNGDYVEVGQVARGWRLRDGHTVLAIWNAAFDPVGNGPGTGTVSPNVERIIKEAPGE